MPELPEVETVVQGLRRLGVQGQRVRSVTVRWPRSVCSDADLRFSSALAGRQVLGIARRGKQIVLSLSGGLTLLIHLRMTGRLMVTQPDEPMDRHVHVILRLSNRTELRFRDTRKFGRMVLTAAPDAVLGALGPEPLASDFRPADFEKRLRSRAAMLKPLLLNQQFLAGIGNIYVDEALWRARLHPRRLANTLNHRQNLSLFKAIREVLRSGIRRAGTSLGTASTNFHNVDGEPGSNQAGLKVFRRTGQPCPRCGTRIERILVGQRSTHLCPVCQELHNPS
jgi:formamidopyrimidine-DNA glycosylase